MLFFIYQKRIQNYYFPSRYFVCICFEYLWLMTVSLSYGFERLQWPRAKLEMSLRSAVWLDKCTLVYIFIWKSKWNCWKSWKCSEHTAKFSHMMLWKKKTNTEFLVLLYGGSFWTSEPETSLGVNFINCLQVDLKPDMISSKRRRSWITDSSKCILIKIHLWFSWFASAHIQSFTVHSALNGKGRERERKKAKKEKWITTVGSIKKTKLLHKKKAQNKMNAKYLNNVTYVAISH